jgi:soluble lytic murein transglycosylase
VRHVVGLALVVALMGSAASCRQGSLTGGAPVTSVSRSGAAPLVNVLLPAQPARPEDAAWRRAVSEQRWEQAALLFDQQQPHPTTPEFRYVRARIASELAQHEVVVDLLNGIEPQLPGFESEIARLRASARAEVGPFDAAAHYFARADTVDGWMRTAKIWRKANAPDRALSAVESAWRLLDHKSATKEAEVRSLRAELLQIAGKPSLAERDYLWLALEGATSNYATAAVHALATAVPPRPLSKPERFRRLEAFSAAGKIDAVLEETQHMKVAPGTSPPPIALKRALAWAYYKSRADYLKAAELFAECARLDSTDPSSDLFFSARSLSRAHQDELAIVRYQELLRRYPGSSHAVTAQKLIGRLWYSLGEWRKAVASHDTFSSRYGRNKRRIKDLEEARFERALSLLALSDARAVPALRDLVAEDHNGDRERALLMELLALAHQQQGARSDAVALYKQVIAELPLSFPALMAAARLRQLGESVPGELAPPDAEDLSLPPPLVVTLPPKVNLLVNLGLDLDAEAELSAQSVTFLAPFAPRTGEAACAAFGQLTTAKERFRRGSAIIRERAVQRAISPGTRWAWDCLYPRPYAPLVEEVETRNGIPSGMVYAVMRQESAFQPTVQSSAAAFGLMQLIEPTAKRMASDLNLPYSKEALLTPGYNVELGAAYLAKLLRLFDGQLALAAAGYNAGPNAAARWLKTSGGLTLDLFVARIPYDETRTYVQRVVGNWARYSYLRGGEKAIPEISLELPASKTLAPDVY